MVDRGRANELASSQHGYLFWKSGELMTTVASIDGCGASSLECLFDGDRIARRRRGAEKLVRRRAGVLQSNRLGVDLHAGNLASRSGRGEIHPAEQTCGVRPSLAGVRIPGRLRLYHRAADRVGDPLRERESVGDVGVRARAAR